MKRIAFGTVMFVLGAVAVAVAKPDLVPLRSKASQNQRICAELADALGDSFKYDEVKAQLNDRIAAKRKALLDMLAIRRHQDAGRLLDEYVRADGLLSATIARSMLHQTFCGLAKDELKLFE